MQRVAVTALQTSVVSKFCVILFTSCASIDLSVIFREMIQRIKIHFHSIVAIARTTNYANFATVVCNKRVSCSYILWKTQRNETTKVASF